VFGNKKYSYYDVTKAVFRGSIGVQSDSSVPEVAVAVAGLHASEIFLCFDNVMK